MGLEITGYVILYDQNTANKPKETLTFWYFLYFCVFGVLNNGDFILKAYDSMNGILLIICRGNLEFWGLIFWSFQLLFLGKLNLIRFIHLFIQQIFIEYPLHHLLS